MQMRLVGDEPPKAFDGDAFGNGRQSSRDSLCGRLAAYFTARPGRWIDGRELATVAGAYGWRTRVSDLRRTPYCLTIENRQRREGKHTISEYRMVVAESTTPEAA